MGGDRVYDTYLGIGDRLYDEYINPKVVQR
jgi:hypothetical protein